MLQRLFKILEILYNQGLVSFESFFASNDVTKLSFFGVHCEKKVKIMQSLG